MTPALSPEDLAIANELCAPIVADGPQDAPAFVKRFAFERAYGELLDLARDSPLRALAIIFHVSPRCGRITWLRSMIANEVGAEVLRHTSPELAQTIEYYIALEPAFKAFLGIHERLPENE